MTAFGGLNHFQGHLKHIIIQGHIQKDSFTHYLPSNMSKISYNMVLSGTIILLYITHANIPFACVKNK